MLYLPQATESSASQVVIHSTGDTKAYHQVQDGFTELETISQDTSLPNAPELLENVFASFYRSRPMLNDPQALTAVQRVQHQMINQMMQTREYKTVRANGTSGQVFPSGLATAAVTQKMLETLDDQTRRQMQQLQQAQEKQQQLERQAEQLAQLANQVADQQDAGAMNQQAQDMSQQAQEMQPQIDTLQSAIDAKLEEIGNAARVAAREGLDQASQQIDDMNKAMRSFTVGAGSQPGQEHLLLNLQEKMELATLLIQNPKLARIAELAGHLIDIALQHQKQKYLYPPTEITGIELGNNIQRVVPSEFLYLALPQLQPWFAKQYAERSLLQRKMIGYKTLGRGPIQFALDGSGSMKDVFDATDLVIFDRETGQYRKPTKEEYSKAVIIALLFIAQRQKRDMIVMHFSSRGDMKQFMFLYKQYTHKDVLACMQFFFNGGTSYEAWMQQSLENAKLAKFKQSSLIVLSDGASRVNEQANQQFNTQRALIGLDALGILVATPQEVERTQGDKKLRQVTDDVVAVTDFASLKTAEEKMFSI